MKQPKSKVKNVVKLLSSLGVNITETKSRIEIMRSLPNVATNKLK
ncbi:MULTISPECIES: Lmo0850 family protein [Mammaliicoccus]|jgi:hypothetical protein|uniref:Lmo0850 family protein n=1 Tax=Mammaliicoccus lentus TaxID=42858 RepID=A0AAX3W3B8_MAMLE|nr:MULTISPECIES: Lmo0850 family protein [Mammaliicoccus]MCD2520169.1 hypothetical protein [Mammaliicoccus lentus]MCR1873555.1 Lmo0850 family protein [Mammaliicoccus lentus]MDQ7142384.1 Lmo0850 family protein [Mammaliicoccus lentus]MEB5685609.1 hypothetical protein [Mammaliicoccus lentus]MEB8092573.1 Lmo0850 family protein [Mammaliicoccus lentus]